MGKRGGVAIFLSKAAQAEDSKGMGNTWLLGIGHKTGIIHCTLFPC